MEEDQCFGSGSGPHHLAVVPVHRYPDWAFFLASDLLSTPFCDWCMEKVPLQGSAVDPDPYWIRIHELPGSGSVFGIRIWIRIHTCKYRLKWRIKMSDLRY